MGILDLLIIILVGLWGVVITFFFGFYFGKKDTSVLIPEQVEEQDGKKQVTKWGEYKVRFFRPWFDIWNRFTQFLNQKVWVVQGIFLETSERGLIGELDIGKRTKTGKVKWRNKKHDLSFWHPKQIILEGGRTFAIFVDGIPAEWKDGRFFPLPLRIYLQMLTDSVVMSKHKYPKQLGNITAVQFIAIAIGILIMGLLVYIMGPKIAQFLK